MPDDPKPATADPRAAIEFFHEANDAESDNRTAALDDLRFSYGDQWPDYAILARGDDRPRLTINELDTYIRRITNAQRQQRPRGKASPVDDKSDPKVAKVITGIGRHVEVTSNADYAYDRAFESAVRMGWGYWRMRTDYVRDDSFDQSIYIDAIDNPFTVYFDPLSTAPDGSDASRVLISDLMKRDDFARQYPGADMAGFEERGAGDSDPDWITKEEIRIAEYFYIDRVPSMLVMLSDGQIVWADKVPPADILRAAGITVQGDRKSMRRTVKWCKQTALEILEEKVIPGRFIPVIPVYGAVMVNDGKREYKGLVRDAKDPCRMNNFWQTAMTEYLALAPKAKWLLADGQDEGHEQEFKNANLSTSPTLRYKYTEVNGQPVGPPQRIAPEMPPAGFIEAAFMANQNLSRVLGVFDPAVRGGAQHKSDKTLNAERSQSENSNFHFFDNLTLSIQHTWRIMLDWTPYVFDTQRVQRIIGEDGKPELVTINERTQAQDESGQAIEKVLNCVCVGEYDVVMETGPGYDTKRQEGVAAMVELMATPIGEQVAAVGADILVRQMDAPGMDILADRMEAANPLAKIDDKSDVPPKAQMMIAQQQKMLEAATKEIERLEMELKVRGGIEQMRQEGQTKRTLITATAAAHDTEARSAAMNHSTEVKAVTAQNIEEIKGIVSLLTKHIDTADLERELAARNVEQKMKHAEQPQTVN